MEALRESLLAWGVLCAHCQYPRFVRYYFPAPSLAVLTFHSGIDEDKHADVLDEDPVRPTYNVTIHRRKLHAITQLPRTIVEGTPDQSAFSTSASSLHSFSNAGAGDTLQNSPNRPRDRRQTLDERQLMRTIIDDPAMLDALRLFYDNHPSIMFSNSPLRPDQAQSPNTEVANKDTQNQDTTNMAVQSSEQDRYVNAEVSLSSISTPDTTMDESFLASRLAMELKSSTTEPLNVRSVGVLGMWVIHPVKHSLLANLADLGFHF